MLENAGVALPPASQGRLANPLDKLDFPFVPAEFRVSLLVRYHLLFDIFCVEFCGGGEALMG